MIRLDEIQNLSLHEKLRMMEALWDGISPFGEELEMPTWHADLLDERARLIQEGKTSFVDWETAKAQIRKSVLLES